MSVVETEQSWVARRIKNNRIVKCFQRCKAEGRTSKEVVETCPYAAAHQKEYLEIQRQSSRQARMVGILDKRSELFGPVRVLTMKPAWKMRRVQAPLPISSRPLTHHACTLTSGIRS